MSDIKDEEKWKNLSQVLYKFNNNDEEIVIIYSMISELYLNFDNNFSENNIYKNQHTIQYIIDLIYNIFGSGICSNRKEYEFYRSLTENNLNNIYNNSFDSQYDINNKENLEKFNKFRKYLELLNFVKNKYNKNIDLICKSLPKWFVSYLGFNYHC